MARSAGEPEARGRSSAKRTVPFGDVLAAAQGQERTRLRRYRRRWIVQHVAVIVVASAVVAVCAPTLFGDDEIDPWSALGVLATGGWFGTIALVGLTGFAVLAIPFSIARIVAVIRSDDLAAFERVHRPWWVERVR